MKDAQAALYHPVSLNREYLAGKMLEKFSEKYPKTWNNFSMERRVQVREAFLAALRSLEESLATASPAFLIDHARWVQSRFVTGHFPEKFAASFFSVFKDVLSRELPQNYRKNAGAFAGKAVTALKSPPAGTPPGPEDRIPLSPVARSFLRYLLAGERDRAAAVIDKALAAGTPVKEIYTSIFQPVLRETGRLWQLDEATIAQEHFVSSAIHRIMDQRHDRIVAAGGNIRLKKTIVAACAGEELHEIGLRIVADFLEMDGWDVYYTGANTPVKSILDAVKGREAGVVILSITMPSRLPDLRYLVRSLRADADLTPVKIIVGGNPFAIIPDLWKRVGADAVAADAEGAVAAARRLAA
jgi:methanogenic corrinoid protein MtbC1